MVREETDKKTRPPGQTLYGQRFGRICPMHRKRKEKQKWAIGTPKLDNARRLRGIYFIDPDVEEFKDVMKKARRKLEIPMPAAMLCKLQRDKYRETVAPLEDTR